MHHLGIWGRGIAPLQHPSYQRPQQSRPLIPGISAISRERIAASPCHGLSPSLTTTLAPCPWASRPVGPPAVHPPRTSEREVGGPLRPCPHSLRGAGPSEGAPAGRWPLLRVPRALRRWRQRPASDRSAWDVRQSSWRRVTRGALRHRGSGVSPFSALSAGSCPLALASAGKPRTQGSPLHPSHLRGGCSMHYCGAPDAGGRQLQALVRLGHASRTYSVLSVHPTCLHSFWLSNYLFICLISPPHPFLASSHGNKK
jgi:hypothetical protein